MKVEATSLNDCFTIEMPLFGDDRGFFLESFHFLKFQKATGISFDVKQINFAKSQKNVLRGMHYQTGSTAQAKLVSVISGAVLDVVVDIRPESTSYLQHFKVVLDRPNLFIYVPRGFAHGYYTLKENTLFYYAVDNFYSPNTELGLLYNDPMLKIDWELTGAPLISKKDTDHPLFNNNKQK